MVSILMYLFPDEAQQEISMKFKTTRKDAAALRQIMLEVDEIIAYKKRPEVNQRR